MRVTTLMNQVLRLPGLRLTGVLVEEEKGRAAPILVIEIARRFRVLTCPDRDTRVRSLRRVKVWTGPAPGAVAVRGCVSMEGRTLVARRRVRRLLGGRFAPRIPTPPPYSHRGPYRFT